ncbi:DUF998 domain-containing protein [Pseudomarimonas arenosa]|uniref:DUF998 domain-containing protein n=1 Tax=Pseudomarimonas arenosa TaxID=2774145 RepID=A0AAW3ZRH3_9GAMM|nr:DUF998 domain-containing protein [Pseudomarimonas arenosa]MBD8528064.1 DUF998 domain-containing protein [Pseudomarimonas arenosa]
MVGWWPRAGRMVAAQARAHSVERSDAKASSRQIDHTHSRCEARMGFARKNGVYITRWLAIATIVFGSLFYLVGAALKPDYSHLSHFISELNASGTPWARSLGLFGFVPLGLLFSGFLIAASPLVQVGGASRVGFWLLWSQPVAFIGVALAPCDPGCPLGGSLTQVAHDILGVLTYFAGAAAMVLLSFSPVLSPHWRSTLMASGIAWMLLFVLMLQPELAQVRGLLQRIADGLLAMVVALVAWRLVGQPALSRGALHLRSQP